MSETDVDFVVVLSGTMEATVEKDFEDITYEELQEIAEDKLDNMSEAEILELYRNGAVNIDDPIEL